MSSPRRTPQTSGRASAEPSTFPNPTDIGARRLSITSQQTDDFTEYGDNEEAANAAHAAQASRLPDPSSRPSTAQTGITSQGGLSTTTAQGRLPQSYAGSVGAGSNRPATSSSRTHVPSLAASAFYRPISSQRLQAQRNHQRRDQQLPQTPVGRQTPEQTDELDQVTPRSARKLPRPISRGTDITDVAEADDDVPPVPAIPIPERGTASPDGSEAALQRRFEEKPPNSAPGRLDLSRLKGGNISQAPKSPRSFRSSLRNSRASFGGRQHGHEKLPSNASTPNFDDATKEIIRKELGKNYEYFTGNTVFLLGGRLQNTRDRPINIFTGIMIVLPVVLFYGFSYV